MGTEMERSSNYSFKISKRTKQELKKCQVCERVNALYTYYGAICCGGCKQFFRRSVLGNIDKIETCPEHNPSCDLTKVKCRHCRLSKCIQVGMDRKLVKLAAEWCPLVNSIKQIERAFKRIWDSSRPLPEAYTNRYHNLAGVLQENQNLLANVDQFPEDQFGWDKAQFLYEIETNGLLSIHALHKHAVKDWFLMVELTKSLPFFKQLNMDDQVCHMSHVVVPLQFIFNAYYSHAISAKCVTRKNGMPATVFLEAKQIQGDQIIRKILMQFTCRLVEMMSESVLEYDEFLLLSLILFTHSTADGLSANGRELLYNESIHYSKALHKLLQYKFGFFGGAQKFAALINVLNYAVSIKNNVAQLVVYIEVFYTNTNAKCNEPYAVPKVTKSIIHNT